MNVILAKECEESKNPTPRKLTFILDWNFFWNNYDVIVESYKLQLIQSIVENRAKRMPESTVETNDKQKRVQFYLTVKSYEAE